MGQLYTETLSRCEIITFARPGYVPNTRNHYEDANFLPYFGYNKVGLIAEQLYQPKPEKPPEQTQDRQEIPSDIIPRQKHFVG